MRRGEQVFRDTLLKIRPFPIGFEMGFLRFLPMLFLILGGCSLSQRSGESRVRISLPPEMKGSAVTVGPKRGLSSFFVEPTGFQDLNCFAVVVTGPGIENDPQFGCSAGKSPVGISVGFFSSSQSGLDVLVPPGPDRKIQLVALNSEEGCPDFRTMLAGKKANGASFGDPYLVGESTLDVFGDVSVDLSADFDPGSKFQLPCGWGPAPECSPGYQWDASLQVCTLVASCPAGKSYDSQSKSCICPVGQEDFDGTNCVPICSPGYMLVNSSCVPICGSGFNLDATNQCVAIAGCGAGMRYDSNFGSCVMGCYAGYTPGVNSSCVPSCNTGFSLNTSDVCAPTCSAGTVPGYQSTCVGACPAGQVLGTDDSCHSFCPAGQILGRNNTCVTPCPAGQVLDGNDHCLTDCPSGYHLDVVGNTCETCDPDQYWDGGRCVQKGFVLDAPNPGDPSRQISVPDLSCKEHQFLAGVRVRTGAIYDQIQLMCRTYYFEFHDEVTFGPMMGGFGGNSNEFYCPSQSLVSEIKAASSSGWGGATSSLRLTCKNISTSALADSGSNLLYYGGSTFGCPAGQYVYGLKVLTEAGGAYTGAIYGVKCRAP
ncbi:MAG: hypothetical protein EBX52_11065 [Proteobacteria bacterium]|nr:hypothetical protein [Pseudomonadota bacterium]